MEQKPVGGCMSMSVSMSSSSVQSQAPPTTMKRSPSELALQEFIATNISCFPDTISVSVSDDFFTDPNLSSFIFKNRTNMNDLASCGEVTESHIWSQNTTPKPSTINDSQSSICGNWSAGSPTSASKPKGKERKSTRGATSGSSLEQLVSDDEEDVETEAGPCEQSSTDPIVLKQIRRKVSNKESAMRSRKRKQAYMVDLEFQVEQLKGEYASLHKQLTEASQVYCDADTSNRVLKSDVEALRAKVKLAEDIVTRGSLTCGLNQLLQSHLISTPHQPQIPNASVSSTITVRNNNSDFAGNIGLASDADHINNTNSNGVLSDAVSCVSEMWR